MRDIVCGRLPTGNTCNNAFQHATQHCCVASLGCITGPLDRITGPLDLCL